MYCDPGIPKTTLKDHLNGRVTHRTNPNPTLYLKMSWKSFTQVDYWVFLNPMLSKKECQKENRSVMDGGKGFLNASQISYVVTVLLMYEWTQ